MPSAVTVSNAGQSERTWPAELCGDMVAGEREPWLERSSSTATTQWQRHAQRETATTSSTIRLVWVKPWSHELLLLACRRRSSTWPSDDLHDLHRRCTPRHWTPPHCRRHRRPAPPLRGVRQARTWPRSPRTSCSSSPARRSRRTGRSRSAARRISRTCILPRASATHTHTHTHTHSVVHALHRLTDVRLSVCTYSTAY